MASELVGAGGLLALFALLALRAPIGLAMLAVGVAGTWALSLVHSHLPFVPYLKQFKSLLWSVASSYELSVLPLFILMGCLSASIGISRDLFAGAAALVGKARGGVAMAAVAACAGFGAVCGSSLATASAMGRIALPELARARYEPGFAAGVLAAGGTLGILIPPSVVLVIYAIIVEASILDMFRAALVPGLMAVLFFLALISLLARRYPGCAGETRDLAPAERRRDLLRAAPAVLIFGAIIGGLILGLFAPTPAAAIGVFAVLAYGAACGRLTREDLGGSFLETAKIAGMICFLLLGAEVLKGFFARSGLPMALAAWAQTADIPPLSILVIVLLALLLLGCFMDSLSMILVMVPFFWPVLSEINGGEWVLAADAAFGMDQEQLKIWFGILCLVVVELGLITPPVGLNVFVIAAVAKGVALARIFRGVAPFVGVEILRVAAILAIPSLALWLPGAL